MPAVEMLHRGFLPAILSGILSEILLTLEPTRMIIHESWVLWEVSFQAMLIIL